MLDSRIVGNRLLLEASQYGESMGLIRLLKLSCLAHGWMLALHDRPLLDEPLEIWRWTGVGGPCSIVAPRLYDAFRHNRGEIITRTVPAPIHFPDGDEADIISQTWATYGKMITESLTVCFYGLDRFLSSRNGHPPSDEFSTILDNMDIRDFFRRKMSQNRQEAA